MKRRLLGAALLVLTEAATALAQVPADLPPPRVVEEAAPAETANSAPVTHGSICNFDWATSAGPEKCWLRVDYLHWLMRKQRVPPLVTTSAPDTPLGDVGILGLDTTRVLFGDEWSGYGSHGSDAGQSGLRLTGVVWLRDDLAVGILGSYFRFDSNVSLFEQNSNELGQPALIRPYVSPFTQDEQAYRVAFPGALAGGVAVTGSSRLCGGELAIVIDLAPYCGYRTYLTAGCRYIDLAEDLNVNDHSTVLAGGALAYRGDPLGVGDRAVVIDSFDVWNHYLGAQLGLRGAWDWGPLTLDVAAKVAFGTTTQVVEARGFSAVFRQNGVNDVSLGGVLALETNSQRQVEDEFTVLPEASIQVSYNVTANACVFLGYDFLFWHTVARPAEQISRSVNITQVPTSLAFDPIVGAPVPPPVLRTSDFWAQGLSIGFSLRY